APADQDPVAATWVWLADAPLTPRGSRAPDQSPGPNALDLAIQELKITSATRNPQILVRPALAARLGTQLASLPIEERLPLLKYLAAHEELAAELAFLLDPRDDIPAAYRVLARLLEAHGDRVAELAPLAAAICAVHDQPKDRHINENTLPLIDPVELFGYYATHERQMRFSLAEAPTATPATLLVHLADATGTIAEYDWARTRYRRDKNIGNRYKEIAYDTRALTDDGYVKRVTAAGGYSLQTIRELGGVCADQAYFALSVGKALGVPACYVRGKGGETSHAWVGFLEQTGRQSTRWNFTAGRYAEFEDVQGTLLDPQTGETIPDAFLSIVAMSTSASLERRQDSLALVDAASRLGFLASRSSGGQGLGPEVVAQQLDLLESALRTDLGNLRAWIFARNLLTRPTTTLAQKEHWTMAIDQLAAQVHPDFAFEMLAPIFAAESDLDIRFNLWDWAATRFGGRPDLAARARLAQTHIMLEQGRQSDAILAAHAVFTQHPDAGPYAVEALVLAERLLEEAGRQEEAMAMYAQAFETLKAPRRLQKDFLAQTSWHQIGTRYAELLEAAGETRQAESLRRRLGR
ncbi:hypothetical protein MNBD_PLANCTO03-1671, partial [hydrothermal vent metagenome]